MSLHLWVRLVYYDLVLTPLWPMVYLNWELVHSSLLYELDQNFRLVFHLRVGLEYYDLVVAV